MKLIEQIQTLSNQIAEFLSDKEGFKVEITHHGVGIVVTYPSGDTMDYDVYELLLYTLAVRKLGSDIELKINKDENGNEVFAVNTDAKLDIPAGFTKINESFIGFKHDSIQSVFIGRQIANTQFPYTVMTLYKNGNWMRQDLVMAEVLYALTHDLSLELVDSAFCFKRIRKLSADIQAELKELNELNDK